MFENPQVWENCVLNFQRVICSERHLCLWYFLCCLAYLSIGDLCELLESKDLSYGLDLSCSFCWVSFCCLNLQLYKIISLLCWDTYIKTKEGSSLPWWGIEGRQSYNPYCSGKDSFYNCTEETIVILTKLIQIAKGWQFPKLGHCFQMQLLSMIYAFDSPMDIIYSVC